MKEYGSSKTEKVKHNPFYEKKGVPHMKDGADSGCMPNGRRKADNSGEQVKPWKHNGEK